MRKHNIKIRKRGQFYSTQTTGSAVTRHRSEVTWASSCYTIGHKWTQISKSFRGFLIRCFIAIFCFAPERCFSLLCFHTIIRIFSIPNCHNRSKNAIFFLSSNSCVTINIRTIFSSLPLNE